MNPMGIHPPRRRRAGFTALEVTAVAAIIAILALVLIPIMRSRVEDAKVVAAQDDMRSIETAETLTYADVGHYVRLQDLTRPGVDPAVANNPASPDYATQVERVPHAYWNRELIDSEIGMMARSWKGTQIAMHHTAPLQRIQQQQPYLFSDGSSAGGPILFLGANGQDDVQQAANASLGIIQYPLDPWGNPYIFFGSGTVTDPIVGATSGGQAIRGLQPSITAETNFQTAVVFSMGPDGVPGVGTTNLTDSIVYYREAGALGAAGSDDLSREF